MIKFPFLILLLLAAAAPSFAQNPKVGGTRKVLVSTFEGNVVAVNAVSGPEKLREVNEGAAMGVKFAVPYISGGAPIYVEGFIVYTFIKNGKVQS